MALYTQVYSGRIRLESLFGIDPLSQSNVLKQQRESEHAIANNIEAIFGDVVNGRPALFEHAVLSFIEITNRLALQLP